MENAQNSDATGHNNEGRQRRLKAIEPFRWQKGQSGNPGGRPKRKPISEAYEKFLQFKDDAGLTAAERVAQAVIMQALKGNIQAVKEMTDRVEGSVRQSLDVALGGMTDEEIRTLINDLFADESGAPAGGETPGDEPGGDPAAKPTG